MVVAQTIVFGVVIGLYVVPVAVYLVYRAGKWTIQKWRFRKTRRLERPSNDNTNDSLADYRRRRYRNSISASRETTCSSNDRLNHKDYENRKNTEAETSPLLPTFRTEAKTNVNRQNVRKDPLSPQEVAVQMEMNAVLAASQSLSRSRSFSRSEVDRLERREYGRAEYRDDKRNNSRQNRRPDGCSTSDEEHEHHSSLTSKEQHNRDRPNRRRVYSSHRNDKDRSSSVRKEKNRTSHRASGSEWHMPSSSTDVSEAIGSSVSESRHSTQSIGDKVLRRHALLYGVDMV